MSAASLGITASWFVVGVSAATTKSTATSGADSSSRSAVSSASESCWVGFGDFRVLPFLSRFFMLNDDELIERNSNNTAIKSRERT